MSLSARFLRDPGCIVALARELAADEGVAWAAAARPSRDGDPASDVDLRAEAVLIQREIGRLAGAPPLLAELDAALCAPNAAAIVQALADLGALSLLLPEVHAFIGFHRSSPLGHKDLWVHTLTVLERTAPDADLRWIALCHDIGKVATRAVGADGRLAFHRHEAVGARLFVGIGARLAMPAERVHKIAFVIEHHARTNQFEPSWSDRALRRLIRDSGEHLPSMLAFSSADWTTKKAARAERIQKQLELLRTRIAALSTEVDDPLPEGIADALLAQSGREAGPWIGAALRWAHVHADELADLEAAAIAARYLATASRSE